jgi:hypothetical protein
MARMKKTLHPPFKPPSQPEEKYSGEYPQGKIINKTAEEIKKERRQQAIKEAFELGMARRQQAIEKEIALAEIAVYATKETL